MKIVNIILKIIAWVWLLFWTVGILIMISTSRSLGDVPLLIVMICVIFLPPIAYLVMIHKAEIADRRNESIGKENKSIENQNIKSTSFIKNEDGKMIFSFRALMNDSPSTVTIDGNWLTIERRGGFNTIKHGLDGKKKINIKNITAVQIKEGGIMSGYIQFVLLGSYESKGGLGEAHYDENSVIFGPDYNETARELVNMVENKINKLQNISSINPQIVQRESVAKQLKDLKELVDCGILTHEEFDKQKEKILNN